MKTKIIKVTKRDIKKARKILSQRERDDDGSYAKYCPISLAAKRTFKKKRVRVKGDFIQVSKRYFDIDSLAQGFIDDFDCGKHVNPITLRWNNNDEIFETDENYFSQA